MYVIFYSTLVHTTFFYNKLIQIPPVSFPLFPSLSLFLLSPGLCGVFEILLNEMRWIPLQAKSTILAAGLW